MAGMATALSYLELLVRDAAAQEFDGPLDAARAAGEPPDALGELARARDLALRVHRVLDESRRHEAQLAALFETVGELSTRTGTASVLQTIVHRSRRLLGSDVAYLTLVDEAVGDTYTTIIDGGVSALFRGIRVPMGDGVGGLVAERRVPFTVTSYFEDTRIRHTPAIDAAVRDEGLVALLGVPLVVDERVIGVLFVANRTERPFSAADTALLASFAAHAAVALDKARLLGEARTALAELQVAGDRLREQAQSTDRAARAHERFSAIVLEGGDVEAVGQGLKDVLGGEVVIVGPDDALLGATCATAATTPQALAARHRALTSTVTRIGPGACSTPVVAGDDVLGAVILLRDVPLSVIDQRILERAAMVTALLLLFRRSLAASEERLRGELLEDLLLDRSADGLGERMRLVGVDPDAAQAVVVAEITGSRTPTAQAAAFLAESCHGLSAVHEGRLVVTLPGLAPKDAAALVGEKLRMVAGHPVTAGVAGPARGPAEVRAAYAEARTCLQALLALGRPGQVAGAGDLGFLGLLLAKDGDPPGFVRAVLGPVLDYDAAHGTVLEQTLRTFFDQAGSIARTASVLHVHPKTVTQRLDRVARLLGPGWTGPDTRLQIQVALQLRRVLGGLGG